jgi:hypothetical protein
MQSNHLIIIPTKMAESTLPKLADLLTDIELKADQNDLNILLNTPPRDTWIKQHPFAKGVKYLPIERVEYLLTRIFIRWHVEIKSVQILANSIVTTVRLYYLDRLSNQMLWQDGVGAAPLQINSGKGAIDFNEIKSNAVMLAAPASETFAIKDAAEKIGKIFGKDLNRHDQIMYDSLSGNIIKPEKEKKLNEMFNDKTE